MAVVIENRIDAKPGTIIAVPVDNYIPKGWLICNGAPISRTQYAALFAVIGTTYGAGDGSTTFNLPNFQGKFLRGYGSYDANRSSGSIGSVQDDALQNHHHNRQASWGGGGHNGGYWSLEDGAYINAYPDFSSPLTKGNRAVSVADETRPVNMAVVYLIKY